MKWLITAKEKSESSQRYVEWLKRGEVDSRIIVPEDPVPEKAAGWAALMLSGGGDVAPALYNEPQAPQTDDVSTARDAMELRLIERFLKAKKPIFGVCRGLQLLNVALGGKLIQHLPGPQLAGHKGAQDVTHGLRWNEESAFAGQLGAAVEANSAHHQAIDPNAVGGGLKIAAWSTDGVVEAVEGIVHGSHLRAVQWHPERMQPMEQPASQGLLEYWIQIVAS